MNKGFSGFYFLIRATSISSVTLCSFAGGWGQLLAEFQRVKNKNSWRAKAIFVFKCSCNRKILNVAPSAVFQQEKLLLFLGMPMRTAALLGVHFIRGQYPA